MGAILVLIPLARRRVYPWCLVLAGCLLAMGNTHSFLPGYYFKFLFGLNGVRVFPRFQILTMFGLALIAARRIGGGQETLWPRRLRVGPCTIRRAALPERCSFLASAGGPNDLADTPNHAPSVVLSPLAFALERGTTRQTWLLEQGYWPQTCYEPMRLPPLSPTAQSHALRNLVLMSKALTYDCVSGKPPESGAASLSLNATMEDSPCKPRFPVNIRYFD